MENKDNQKILLSRNWVEYNLADPLMVLLITTGKSVLNKRHIMNNAITRLGVVTPNSSDSRLWLGKWLGNAEGTQNRTRSQYLYPYVA